MADQDSAHSSCISLRLDKATLANIEDKLNGATLSAALDGKLTNMLGVLAKNAKKEEGND